MIYGIPSIMVSRSSRTGFYRSITLSTPASDLTNFPVLFSGTFTYLKTVANGGKVQSSSGYDITFYADATLLTPLKFERIYWSASTGTCEFRIKVPTVASAASTVIYIAYGNPNINTDQQDAASVWSNSFITVLHMPDGSTLSLNDSLGAHNGSMSGTVGATTGQIDGGASFGGSAYIILGDSNDFTFPAGGNGFTMDVWANKSNSARADTLFEKYSTGSPQEYVFGFFTDNKIYGWIYDTVNTAYIGRTAPSSTYGILSYYKITMVYDGGTTSASVKIYVNGTQVDDTNFQSGSFATMRNTTTPLNIGAGNAGLGGTNFLGSMDEAKISSVARSATWILTEYNNENDPASFCTVGSEIPV